MCLRFDGEEDSCEAGRIMGNLTGPHLLDNMSSSGADVGKVSPTFSNCSRMDIEGVFEEYYATTNMCLDMSQCLGV